MIPINNREKIQTNFDDSEDIECRVSGNRFIMEILRKTIYTDPIGACVREVFANAYDSHRRKGNTDQPVHITLNDSYFVVKDFGGGMDPDSMKDIYFVYGESTKREDNVEQGQFGIGGQSPFAVSDIYIVETVWGGVKYTYQAYIDDSGNGRGKLLSEEPSDDCGVTIRVPIGNHRNEFKQAIYKYTIFYPTQPKVFGEFMPPIPKPIIKTQSWRAYEGLRSVGNPNVILDSIPYKYYMGYNYDLPDGVVLICNVGDLEITASRESLRECEHNTTFLRRMVENYRKDIYQITYDKIKEEKDHNSVIQMLVTSRGAIKEPKVYEWNGTRFQYPLETSIRRFDKNSYRKYIGYLNQTLGKSTAFMRGGENPLTNKQKRQLGTFWKTHNENVYMVPDDFIFPSIDINSIAIAYPKNQRSNTPKYVTARRVGKRHFSRIPFEEKILYTLDNPDKLESPYLLHEIVQVEEKSIKRIKKYTKWQSLEEYLGGFGNADELAEKGVIVLNESDISKWRFLKDHVSEEINQILSVKIPKENTELLNVCKFLCHNRKLEYIGHLTKKLTQRYPLLANLSDYSVWHDKSTQKNVIDYVKLIEQTKEKK